MKNPNGYGSVVKLSGKNRRKPYVVRKTIGWGENGHPIYLTIDYAASREEGNIILAKYNNSPWDVDKAKTTFAELCDLWKKQCWPKLGESNQKALSAAVKHCEKLNDKPYRDIRSFHMQDCIDSCERGYSTQSHIKNLFSHLDNFAFELDIIDKRHSELLSAESIPDTNKKPFTASEQAVLWKSKNKAWVDSILTFLYTGFRLNELLGLEVSKVDLEEKLFTGGSKTRNGKDRIVPIHSKIFPLIKKRYDECKKNGYTYLFHYEGKRCTDYRYYTIWYKILNELDIKHTPHECRHTFRSRLDSAGANKVSIDLLMGHKSKDVGERIYTHKTIQELRDSIELLN